MGANNSSEQVDQAQVQGAYNPRRVTRVCPRCESIDLDNFLETSTWNNKDPHGESWKQPSSLELGTYVSLLSTFDENCSLCKLLLVLIPDPRKILNPSFISSRARLCNALNLPCLWVIGNSPRKAGNIQGISTSGKRR